MANQLVVIGNRIIAHGTDCFADIGGAVACLTDGKVYAGASIVECSADCPDDIDAVGYEYHAGVFVPCAPYGKGNGNGYFMEVCPDCATPRSSGIPIKDINWGKVGSVTCVVANTADGSNVEKNYSLPISDSVLAEYSMLRYRIKAGSYFTFGHLSCGDTAKTYNILTVSGKTLYNLVMPARSSYPHFYNTVLEIKKDIIIPFYITNSSHFGTMANVYGETGTGNQLIKLDGEPQQAKHWYLPEGVEIDPLTIKLSMPGGDYHNGSYCYTNANVVIELEGRK